MTLLAAASRLSLSSCPLAERWELGTNYTYLCALLAAARRQSRTSCRVAECGELAGTDCTPPHPCVCLFLPFPFFSFQSHSSPFLSLPSPHVLPASLLTLCSAGSRLAARSDKFSSCYSRALLLWTSPPLIFHSPPPYYQLPPLLPLYAPSYSFPLP